MRREGRPCKSQRCLPVVSLDNDDDNDQDNDNDYLLIMIIIIGCRLLPACDVPLRGRQEASSPT